MSLYSVSEEVRHHLTLEDCPVAENIGGFLVKVPRYTVGAVAVESGVRGHKTECAPSLIEVGSTLSLKAGNIVAEIAETA